MGYSDGKDAKQVGSGKTGKKAQPKRVDNGIGVYAPMQSVGEPVKCMNTDTLPEALVLLNDLISSAFSDLRALEETIRSHMPNHLYEDNDACEKSPDPYGTPTSRRSPTFVSVVEAVNSLDRLRSRIQWLQNEVVV